MTLAPLPVDAILPQVADFLRRERALVLEAAPGAGKTTRVPIALLRAGVIAKDVLVLQPRKIAARLAARRVAYELGERPGETVGWQVRFEEVAGPKTRLLFLTEGVLLRRLAANPDLSGVGAVFLDEFHERHLESDVALALLRRLGERRPELRLVVMSATLDTEPIARWLGSPVVRCETKRFDVAVEYAPSGGNEPLEKQVVAALRRLLNQGLEGDVLVFLPGVAEIRRAAEACAELARAADLLLLPLHGSLSPEEQDRAVRPADRRKVILSTNVAETSVTIDGVVAVIDSGLARVPSVRAWSGVPTLRLSRVSRASAAQRAGRAGRTRPGRCIRLYAQQDHDSRPPEETPEIRRLDLAETVLMLKASGVAPEELDWLEPPPQDALSRASELLERLGALDGNGVTPLGRRMLRFPLHPRLSRLVLEAETRGVGEAGVLLAALLAERDIRPRSETARREARLGQSDLLERREDFGAAARAGFERDRLRRLGLEPGAVSAVERVRRQLARILARGGGQKSPPGEAEEKALALSLLTGFPDRVARRRSLTPGRREETDEILLASGGSATLAPSSGVSKAAFLLALDAERVEDPGSAHRVASSRVVVRLASAIEPEWLIDLFPDRVREEVAVSWNPAAERVEATSRLLYESLVLEESPGRAEPSEVTRVLLEAARARGASAFAPAGEIDRFLARVSFVSQHCPEAGVRRMGEEDVDAALADLCRGRRSFAELREAGLLEALESRGTPEVRRAVEKLAPDRITLPGGRSVRVHYETGKTPWVESRLQDFFGMGKGPSVAGGQVPLLLHLLAPNGRAVQVTSDLAGFWERTYPGVRRELSRKYPKHAWPEDPRRAKPPSRGKRG